MISTLRSVLREYGLAVTARLVVRELWFIIAHRTLRGSYSQGWEDLVIDRLLGHPADGFYVDIGANDPVRVSNTYRFYRRGWHGLVVDASPLFAERHVRIRPRDTFVNVGVGSTTGEQMPFYMHAASALSTFSQEQSDRCVAQGHPRTGTTMIPLMTMADLLAAHLEPDQPIDLLSLDVEGFDLLALQSNDWTRWRPRLICVELVATGRADQRPDPAQSEVNSLLTSHGYELVETRAMNAFYRDSLAA